MGNEDSGIVGSGGGLPYLAERDDSDVVNQERAFSCQAACARQLLRDAGTDVSEGELLAQIGYLDGWGTSANNTGAALDKLHPTLGFVGGSVDPTSIAILCRRDPWIASLKTDQGTIHAVIVDTILANVVYVRDPWGRTGPGSGNGTRATMNLDAFMERWAYALNIAVFPNRTKKGEGP